MLEMSEPQLQFRESHPRGLGSQVFGYLRKHPLLCLVLLSPGIPEYLSGSSSWAVLTANPILFFLFVGLNVGLYGPGVILIREAMIRWRKGWGISIPPWLCLRHRGRRSCPQYFFQPEGGTSRCSRDLRALVRCQLGVDCRSSIVPFSNLNRFTNPSLSSLLPRLEIDKSGDKRRAFVWM